MIKYIRGSRCQGRQTSSTVRVQHILVMAWRWRTGTLTFFQLRRNAAQLMLPLLPWIKGTVEGVEKASMSVLNPVRRGSERIQKDPLALFSYRGFASSCWPWRLYPRRFCGKAVATGDVRGTAPFPVFFSYNTRRWVGTATACLAYGQCDKHCNDYWV